MKKNNRTCIVCGEKYTYCPTCSEYSKLKPWHSIYHNENCKELYTTASDYLANTITKEEASDKFNKCDLSYRSKLHKVIANTINEVLSNVIETVVEETEDIEEVKKPVYKTKNKQKNLNSDCN